MKAIWKFVLILLFLSAIPIGLASAEETRQQSQVFDLGDVLIMDKGDEVNSITTTETVSMEDIEMQGAQTVADALEMIPGIDVMTTGKNQSSIKLRGFDQKQVRVLIDGVPAHESWDGSLALDMIPVDSIAKIKTIKGASSVLYGPNTLGGVINIITKKGGEKPYTSLITSFGANDTQNYIVNHGASKGNWNYWVTAGHRVSDGFELSNDFNPNNTISGIGTNYNENGGLRDLSYYTKNTFNAKIGYEYDTNSKLYLSFDYHENEKGIPTMQKRYWEFTNWDQWQLSLSGEHDFTDILSLKARVYYVDHDDSIEDVGGWDANHTTPVANKWFERSTYEDYTIGGEIQAYLDFGDISLLKMGASYMKDNHQQQDYYDATTRYVVMAPFNPVGYRPLEEYEADIYSFGIEDEVKVTKQLTLNAGVSYDINKPVKNYSNYNRDDIKTWNPQAGLSFDVTEDFNLYASVGKKTRFPQLKELYSVAAGGNATLKHEENIAYEIGVKKRFNKIFDMSVAAFLNDIENRIDRSGSLYVNKFETEIQGFETQLNITTPWNLDATLSYTVISSEEKATASSAATDAANVPDRKAGLDLRYSFDFGLTASFQTIYTDDQIDSYNVRYDDFVVCNAKLVKKIPFFQNVSTDLFIEVTNIFDENYEEGWGPTPGRGFLVGMKVSF